MMIKANLRPSSSCIYDKCRGRACPCPDRPKGDDCHRANARSGQGQALPLHSIGIRSKKLIFQFVFSFALITSASVVCAQAKTIYVSPSGDDSNPGTLERPVSTPAQATEMLSAGDTVYLRAGRYTINRFLWVDEEGVTISSYPGERASIVGGIDERADNPTSIIIIAANRVSLINLDIEGASYYGVKVDVDKQASTTGVVIRGCRIQNTGRDAVKTFNADNLLIEDCEIGPTGARDSSNAEGIDSIGSVGITIRRCHIHDAATNGLYLKGGARDGLIEGCLVERSGHAGILLGQSTDLEFMRDGARFEAINCVARNNLIIGSEAAGAGTYSGNNVRFINNTLYDVAKRMQAAFWVVVNERDVPSERVMFKNNIVVSNSRPVIFIKNLADQLICNSNIYFSGQKGVEFRRETPAGEADSWRFDEWKKNIRVDYNSIVANPMLDEHDLYRLRPTSPAIDHGESITEVMTDYSTSGRPQGAGYDIGAHESAFKSTPFNSTRKPDVARPAIKSSRL